jgi:hypothetical protein
VGHGSAARETPGSNSAPVTYQLVTYLFLISVSVAVKCR